MAMNRNPSASADRVDRADPVEARAADQDLARGADHLVAQVPEAPAADLVAASAAEDFAAARGVAQMRGRAPGQIVAPDQDVEGLPHAPSRKPSEVVGHWTNKAGSRDTLWALPLLPSTPPRRALSPSGISPSGISSDVATRPDREDSDSTRDPAARQCTNLRAV